MDEKTIYCAGSTPASQYAQRFLEESGLRFSNLPDSNVIALLLDVPSFGDAGQLRMGGQIQAVLETLPKDITIYGGNLTHPALDGYQTVDFLKDEYYLAQNAYITAECALDVALPYLTRTIRDCPVLIIGWGRIGKCLSQLLQTFGAKVTVAARKESDRAILYGLGFEGIKTENLDSELKRFRLIYNTVPQLILPRKQAVEIPENCTVIDLASKNGTEYDDVVIARGLPGIHMPESSGKLIAETFLRYYKEGTL